jgi:release factor glutamine methyltransferase
MTHETRPALKIAVPPAGDDWTIGRLLDWTAQHLARKGCEFPRLDAEVLLAHVLDCRRIDLYTRYEDLASDEARDRFRDLVRRRLEGCPVAYLVGRKEFFGLALEVGPDVLIPRPESEFVVMECLRLAKGIDRPRVLDIGTGSGNLAVTVASKLPSAEVSAVDLSAKALHVARRNAAKYAVAERIRFLEGDLFVAIPAEERFDFILSNPPYIAEEDMANLPIGVREYEPHLALNGGAGGYVILDKLLAESPKFLKPGGYLIVEIGAPQEASVRERFGRFPGYELAATVYDYSRHPRVLWARWKQ